MKLLEATKFEDINHRPRPRKWRQDAATIVASFRSQATNMGGGYSFPVTICSLASHQSQLSFHRFGHYNSLNLSWIPEKKKWQIATLKW